MTVIFCSMICFWAINANAAIGMQVTFEVNRKPVSSKTTTHIKRTDVVTVNISLVMDNLETENPRLAWWYAGHKETDGKTIQFKANRLPARIRIRVYNGSKVRRDEWVTLNGKQGQPFEWINLVPSRKGH